MSEQLQDAYSTFREAERCFHESLVDRFPVGSMLSYRHGMHNRVAEVVMHSQDRIKLVGKMGIEYWKYWDDTFVPDHDEQESNDATKQDTADGS